jgi:RNA polymerase sigma factor (sigma-70 family)
LTDGQLLESFLSRRDEAAMEVLVRRHGPMVWGVCCRVLRNHHDAEDAFQTTFLVLTRKAASIASRELLANWLYGVAHQTALKARATAAKRSQRERPVKETPEPAVAGRDRWDDLKPLLDAELSRLPAKYRVVIVLADLQGKTRKEAARQLGLPEGTVASRLARARAMLARRLARHGLVLSGVAWATVLSGRAASASVPTKVVESTIKGLARAAAGQAASGIVASQVATLTEGVLRAMFANKLKIATAVLLTAGVLTFSAGTRLVPTGVGTAAGGENAKALPPSGSARAGKPRAVQVRIAGPVGMRVRLVPPSGQGDQGPLVEAPGRVRLERGKLSGLKLTDVPNRPGVERFPTVEIPNGDEAAEAFVAKRAIPIAFSDEDFDRVNDGELVMKVVYLPTGKKAVGRPGEPITLASYDDPGRDVIAEARRRGTILAVVRLGNIDLGAGQHRDGQGQAHLPLEKAGEPVKIAIGDDGVQGRVVRLHQGKAKGRDQDNRAEQLANQLEHVMRDVATVQAQNEVLRLRLQAADLEVRSLRRLLEQKEQELKKAKGAAGK